MTDRDISNEIMKFIGKNEPFKSANFYAVKRFLSENLLIEPIKGQAAEIDAKNELDFDERLYLTLQELVRADMLEYAPTGHSYSYRNGALETDEKSIGKYKLSRKGKMQVKAIEFEPDLNNGDKVAIDYSLDYLPITGEIKFNEIREILAAGGISFRIKEVTDFLLYHEMIIRNATNNGYYLSLSEKGKKLKSLGSLTKYDEWDNAEKDKTEKKKSNELAKLEQDIKIGRNNIKYWRVPYVISGFSALIALVSFTYSVLNNKSLETLKEQSATKEDTKMKIELSRQSVLRYVDSLRQIDHLLDTAKKE